MIKYRYICVKVLHKKITFHSIRKIIVTYSLSHPLLNPCAVKTTMVVLSKLVVLHICSNWWVMAGGFSHPLLNPFAVKTIIMVVFSKWVVIHICSDWWVMVGGFNIHLLIHVQSRPP